MADFMLLIRFEHTKLYGKIFMVIIFVIQLLVLGLLAYSFFKKQLKTVPPLLYIQAIRLIVGLSCMPTPSTVENNFYVRGLNKSAVGGLCLMLVFHLINQITENKKRLIVFVVIMIPAIFVPNIFIYQTHKHSLEEIV